MKKIILVLLIMLSSGAQAWTLLFDPNYMLSNAGDIGLQINTTENRGYSLSFSMSNSDTAAFYNDAGYRVQLTRLQTLDGIDTSSWYWESRVEYIHDGFIKNPYEEINVGAGWGYQFSWPNMLIRIDYGVRGTLANTPEYRYTNDWENEWTEGSGGFSFDLHPTISTRIGFKM